MMEPGGFVLDYREGAGDGDELGGFEVSVSRRHWEWRDRVLDRGIAGNACREARAAFISSV